ncbi:MAG: FAD-dependent thymidylate synthase, partial [Alphaproteobacteria bacterium]|nr:FAD-dependent thymidylate synthase [Alphaproteobacteria bacterium]
LRADPHAQYEIRVYAEAMLDCLKRWVPLVYEAFTDYRTGGAFLSAAAMKVVKDLIHGKEPTQESSGLSKREWRELMELLERPDETA